MKGAIEVLDLYFNNTQSKRLTWDSAIIDTNIARIRAGEVGHYQGIDRWLYEALSRRPIRDKRVAIIGSADQGFGPWYECVVLAFGGHPVTVEYNRPIFRDDRVTSVHATKIDKHPRFDAALSVSSFEHDGLGRYGDPLNPDGDLEAMAAWRSRLRPGGIMYLTVPLGLDKVVFNAHRVYGRIRLPMLLAGWTVIDRIGFEDALLDRDTKIGWQPLNDDGTPMHPEYPEYSPVFVLRNVAGRQLDGI